MAVWQYQIFIVPEEEINSYFEKNAFINSDDLNEIKWWKYRQLSTTDFDFFISLLPKKKSWSKDILLFGDEASNCLEIIIEQDKIIEISARIDLRTDFSPFIKHLCQFAQMYKCMFLNQELKILAPNITIIEKDVASFPTYKKFLDKLK